MKRVALVTAVLVAAVAVWGRSLPPRRTALTSTWQDGTVRGVVHVHSRGSDGRGTLDEIAAAAAKVGLQYLVVTDHGNGTRRPEPPSYRAGVLLLDAVEISTRGGHYVAVGLPQSPYPLGGDAADVVEDVRRLGGFGIAAHPDSPKAELRWSDWDSQVDAIELINLDTSWRVHAFTGGPWSRWILLESLLAYPLRPTESIARLLTDASPLRDHWLRLADARPIVALAGADAHAKLALRDTEPGDNRYSVPIPSYESSFGAVSVHITPDTPFTGDATADAAALLGGLRRGRAYIAVDGWAGPPAFEFGATSGSSVVRAGDTLVASAPVTLHVRSNAPPGFQTSVWKGSQPLTERGESAFDVQVRDEAAIYTVQVRQPNAPGSPPWISSNPVYVRPDGPRPPSMPLQRPGAIVSVESLFDGRTTAGWSYESDRTSLSVVDVATLVDGTRVRLRYGLSGGAAIGQYSAAAVETPHGVEAADGVAFFVRAEKPMRISVQVRAEVAGSMPQRWERSVLADATERERVVRFDEMTPVGQTGASRPPRPEVRAIMFVVDTTNTPPGASGRLWLGNVRLASVRSER